jgi:hypothetical protein
LLLAGTVGLAAIRGEITVLRVIMRRAGLPCPASDILFAEVDNQFERVSPRVPPAAQTT